MLSHNNLFDDPCRLSRLLDHCDAVSAHRQVLTNGGRADARTNHLRLHQASQVRLCAAPRLHELNEGGLACLKKPVNWQGEYERIEDINLTDADLHAVGVLKLVGAALSDGGILISLDRSPTSASVWWYAQCLEEAGMKVSLARSYLIERRESLG